MLLLALAFYEYRYMGIKVFCIVKVFVREHSMGSTCPCVVVKLMSLLKLGASGKVESKMPGELIAHLALSLLSSLLDVPTESPTTKTNM